MDAWDVFHRCKWQAVASVAGVFWNGIAAIEIESIANMIGIEIDRELLADLRLMEGAAGKILNRKPES